MSLASIMKEIAPLAKQARAIIELESALEQVGSLEGRQRAAEAAVAKAAKERDGILADAKAALGARDAAVLEAQRIVKVTKDDGAVIIAKAKANADAILTDATAQGAAKAAELAAKCEKLEKLIDEQDQQIASGAKEIAAAEAKLAAIKDAIAKITG
jgi:chromosome segregation ATPase